MYIPKQFQQQDPETIRAFIRENGFAILVSVVENKLWATHTPLLLSADGKKLTGHISRANRQRKSFTNNEEVLAIFQGPHTYISSSWYNHENVPTWNYAAVHVYGVLRILEGEQLYQSLGELVDKYEKRSSSPVSIKTMTPEYVKKEMQGVTGFEITISSMEAAFKLSQNRDAENYQRIMNELEKRGDADSLAIKELMKKHAPH
jgi:transcriptional regulator